MIILTCPSCKELYDFEENISNCSFCGVSLVPRIFESTKEQKFELTFEELEELKRIFLYYRVPETKITKKILSLIKSR